MSATVNNCASCAALAARAPGGMFAVPIRADGKRPQHPTEPGNEVPAKAAWWARAVAVAAGVLIWWLRR